MFLIVFFHYLLNPHLCSPQFDFDVSLFAGLSQSENNVGLSRFARWFQENSLPRFVWDSLRHPHGGVRAAAYLAFGHMCLCGPLWEAFVDDLQLSEVNYLSQCSRCLYSSTEEYTIPQDIEQCT